MRSRVRPSEPAQGLGEGLSAYPPALHGVRVLGVHVTMWERMRLPVMRRIRRHGRSTGHFLAQNIMTRMECTSFSGKWSSACSAGDGCSVQKSSAQWIQSSVALREGSCCRCFPPLEHALHILWTFLSHTCWPSRSRTPTWADMSSLTAASTASAALSLLTAMSSQMSV